MADRPYYDYQQHNLKTNLETLRLLRMIAAHTGERHYAVLQRVLAAEWQRVQRETVRKES